MKRLSWAKIRPRKLSRPSPEPFGAAAGGVGTAGATDGCAMIGGGVTVRTVTSGSGTVMTVGWISLGGGALISLTGSIFWGAICTENSCITLV